MIQTIRFSHSFTIIIEEFKMKRWIVLFFFIPYLLFAQSLSDMELVNVKDLIPDVVIDIRYNTTNNFTGQKLYSTDECFASRAMIEDLQLLQDSLHRVRQFNGKSYKKGLGIKIFDAYRPHAVQFLMYQIVGSPYVADPSGGSNHNRGAAVDLTLIDMKTGEALDMGTDFDYFGERAWHTYEDLPQKVLNNRRYLLDIMLHYNFSYYSREWWHYTHVPSQNNPLFDFQMK